MKVAIASEERRLDPWRFRDWDERGSLSFDECLHYRGRTDVQLTRIDSVEPVGAVFPRGRMVPALATVLGIIAASTIAGAGMPPWPREDWGVLAIGWSVMIGAGAVGLVIGRLLWRGREHIIQVQGIDATGTPRTINVGVDGATNRQNLLLRLERLRSRD